ncbi:hypothetical protein D3C86_1652010 [compost metagenome]
MLARRSRLLFLDAQRAVSIAPRVAALIEEELGRDAGLSAFQSLALQYLPRAQ